MAELTSTQTLKLTQFNKDQKTLISSHLFVLRNKDVIYNYIECTEVHDNFTERANIEFAVTIPNGKNTILVKRQNNSVRVKRQSTAYKVKRSSNTIRVK